MKTTMKRLSVALVVGILSISWTFAQTGVIRGWAIDETGAPIVGGNVFVVGTSQGGSINTNGEYIIPGVAVGVYEVQWPSVPPYRVQNVPVQDGGTTWLFPVTNTSDASGGSLRRAIEMRDSLSGFGIIHFNLPGVGVHTFNLVTALPPMTRSTIVDGTTQPGYAGTPLIEIRGLGSGVGLGLLPHLLRAESRRRVPCDLGPTRQTRGGGGHGGGPGESLAPIRE